MSSPSFNQIPLKPERSLSPRYPDMRSVRSARLGLDTLLCALPSNGDHKDFLVLRIKIALMYLIKAGHIQESMECVRSMDAYILKCAAEIQINKQPKNDGAANSFAFE
jgi:hypothetical protein